MITIFSRLTKFGLLLTTLVLVASLSRSLMVRWTLFYIQRIQRSGVLDLSEYECDRLTTTTAWISTARSRAGRCVEACADVPLDLRVYPCFPAPLQSVAAAVPFFFKQKTAYEI